MARQRAGLWTPTNRVRRCSHRISGRPVWDHYFFGRSSRGSETRSRQPSIGTFHRPACGRFRRPSPHRRCASHRGRKCSHRISGHLHKAGHLHKECAGPWAQLMHGFFPTGANRMARRIILNHPSISGKNRARTVVRFLEQRRGGSFAGVVRGERDRPPRDLRSRCCYLPAALTKMRGTLESVQLLLNRALTRPRKGRSWAA